MPDSSWKHATFNEEFACISESTTHFFHFANLETICHLLPQAGHFSFPKTASVLKNNHFFQRLTLILPKNFFFILSQDNGIQILVSIIRKQDKVSFQVPKSTNNLHMKNTLKGFYSVYFFNSTLFTFPPTTAKTFTD